MRSRRRSKAMRPACGSRRRPGRPAPAGPGVPSALPREARSLAAAPRRAAGGPARLVPWPSARPSAASPPAASGRSAPIGGGTNAGFGDARGPPPWRCCGGPRVAGGRERAAGRSAVRDPGRRRRLGRGCHRARVTIHCRRLSQGQVQQEELPMADNKPIHYARTIPVVMEALERVHEAMDAAGLDRGIHHLVSCGRRRSTVAAIASRCMRGKRAPTARRTIAWTGSWCGGRWATSAPPNGPRWPGPRP